MNIQGLHLNFVDCESFLESTSPDILTLCEKNLDNSIDSGSLSVKGYLPLIQKDSSTHMHGFIVYVKEELPFCTGLISRKLYRFLLMFSTSFTSLSALLLFPLSITFFVFCTVFHSIISNIDEVLSINTSANAFAIGDVNVHHKDWLTYSGGTD